MQFFSWETKYATGIEVIDKDHIKLVEMINDLYTAMSRGEGRLVVHDIVNRMVEYSKRHFKREELLLKKAGYIHFASHEEQHDSFIAKVASFIRKLEAGETNISIELVEFLRDWMVDHILNSDKKFVADLKKLGLN